jgi:hypothetical protein
VLAVCADEPDGMSSPLKLTTAPSSMRTATAACVCGRWHQISGLAVNGHTARGHRRLSRRSTAALLAVVVDARMEIAARSMIANLLSRAGTCRSNQEQARRKNKGKLRYRTAVL